MELAEEATGGTGAVRAALRHMARQPGLAAWFRTWARLEQEAVYLATYECRLVPGLLQSEGYARAVFSNRLPPLSDEQLEAQVAARMERQQMFRERPNTSFGFVVDEHVVRRRLGGADVLRGLLDHVLASARLRNVEVQIIPLEREAHTGLDGPLALLETRTGGIWPMRRGRRPGGWWPTRKRPPFCVADMRHSAHRPSPRWIPWVCWSGSEERYEHHRTGPVQVQSQRNAG
ncbi:hypothetical protein SAMN06272781_3143 [Streptomyces sp. 1222.2]|nr:hypothetical protein SAMN06272781_3143 [Streptomyces sp. 1222.2]